MHRKSAIAAFALSLCAAPAFAGERVAFDRAQLDDPAYVAALYEKIEDAAKKECFKSISSSLYFQQRFAACVEDTVETAIAEIGSQALVAHAAAD